MISNIRAKFTRSKVSERQELESEILYFTIKNFKIENLIVWLRDNENMSFESITKYVQMSKNGICKCIKFLKNQKCIKKMGDLLLYRFKLFFTL